MRQLWAIAALMTALCPLRAEAFAFNEVGDAGESLSTAQVVSGSSALESITGTLSGFNDAADLFQIFLTGGQTFSATTVGGANFDTRLFLFDASGFGVYFNDDAASNTLQSTLPANSSFTPTLSGIYYLAIAGFDYGALNADGDRIFPGVNDFSIDVPESAIFTGVFGATGPGGALPLNTLDGQILNEGGAYSIALTGAAAVPEPVSTVGLLVAGASGTLLRLRRKSNQA